MDQPPVVPNIDEQIEIWELHVEMLKRLRAARLRAKSSEGISARVGYHNKMYEVAIWEVTEQYAIDREGNILKRCVDSPMNWLGVKYEFIPASTLDHRGREELCEHLKQAPARP